MIKVFIETGRKKTIAGALDWYGWCRSGRDEASALQALADYGSRYERVLTATGLDFQPPKNVSEFVVAERHEGDATTDFGAPAAVLDVDRVPVGQTELERLGAVLRACWQMFDLAVQKASGKELRKGPRGGGRDLERIINHVLDADQSYLSRLAWRYKADSGSSLAEEIDRKSQAVLDALESAVKDGLPEHGPRGGVIWPVRYFIRRVCWHTLDHAWEIEDRIV